MNPICLVLSLAATFKWEVHQMDAKSTFLHGDLHEEIYMEQPPGFIQIDSSLVCRLKKSLYGLKHAPPPWYVKMDTFLLDIGFSRCHSDNTIESGAKASPLFVGFNDSDWAGDPDDQKSTAEASKESLWLCQILSEFGFQQQHPTTLWCDNQSAIQLCKDPVQHHRSKHIELRMHFIRNLIHDHVLEVQYCSTDDQVADIFTKALTKANFTKLRFMVGVQDIVTKGG
eukprot:PITA_09590